MVPRWEVMALKSSGSGPEFELYHLLAGWPQASDSLL